MAEIRFIDLFSGGGGFSRGFSMAGYKPVLAIDKDEACVESYRSNFPNTVILNSDIRSMHSIEIIDRVSDFDIVIASPPCEGFTTVSRTIMKDPLDRLYTDPRGRLMLKTIELIGDLQPKVFVIENVPGITIDPIPRYIRKEFARVGYDKIYFNLLRAQDYGCPSARKRIFISNVKITPGKVNEVVTVEEAFKGLPDPRYPNDVPNHFYVPLPERFRERVKRLKWGSALDYFVGGDRREYKQYMRLHPNKMAPTIMGKSRFIHPYDDRMITVREQARLMGYPDTHIFQGGVNEQYNQVGESVPPPLAKAVAEYIRDYL